jgi:hypothetical protein
MCCVFNCAYAAGAVINTATTHAMPAVQDPEIRRTEQSFLGGRITAAATAVQHRVR